MAYPKFESYDKVPAAYKRQAKNMAATPEILAEKDVEFQEFMAHINELAGVEVKVEEKKPEPKPEPKPAPEPELPTTDAVEEEDEEDDEESEEEVE